MKPVHDLTGQRFGRLVAVAREVRLWRCRCNCDGWKLVATSDLRSGKVRSCGCLNHEPRPGSPRPQLPKSDIAGQRFGRLTALAYAGRRLWVCRCDCGATTKVLGASLRGGRTRSCGCLVAESAPRGPRVWMRRARADLRGRRFGMLTATEYRAGSRWLCRCDCGRETVVKADNLKRARSCGCQQYAKRYVTAEQQRAAALRWRMKKRAKPSFQRWLAEYRRSPRTQEWHREYRQSAHGLAKLAERASARRARLRGATCDFDQRRWRLLVEAYDGHCAYCGHAADLTEDHIIPVGEGAHTLDNIVPACRSCNSRKSRGTAERLLEKLGADADAFWERRAAALAYVYDCQEAA